MMAKDKFKTLWTTKVLNMISFQDKMWSRFMSSHLITWNNAKSITWMAIKTCPSFSFRPLRRPSLINKEVFKELMNLNSIKGKLNQNKTCCRPHLFKWLSSTTYKSMTKMTKTPSWKMTLDLQVTNSSWGSSKCQILSAGIRPSIQSWIILCNLTRFRNSRSCMISWWVKTSKMHLQMRIHLKN